MTDQQNESADDLPPVLALEPVVQVIPDAPLVPVGTPLSDAPIQVRVSGQPGVRVTQVGELQVKRVTGLQESDAKQVPLAVLAEVRALLDVVGEQPALTAAERLLAVRDLLTPWL
jgi:hypothetical protein